MLIALAALLTIGMAGIVAHHEMESTDQPHHHAKVSTISQGQAVDLEPHIADGKVTVFEFYADW